MRVVVDALAATTGGGITYLRSLLGAALQADEELELVLVVACQEPFSELLESPRVDVVQPLGPAPSLARRIAWELTSLGVAASRLGGDVLFCPSELAPLRSRVPIVLGFQNPNLYERPVAYANRSQDARLRLLLAGARAGARRATATMFVSEPFRRRAAPALRAPGVPQRVVEPGIEPAFAPVAADPEVERLRPYVLAVSDLYPYKNLPLLVEAFRLLGRPHLRLVIAGRPVDAASQAWLARAIEKSGLQERVSVLGAVPLARMPGIYAGAECLAFPSLLESFGFPPLEAMACGVPVACARTSVMPDLLGDAVEWFEGRNAASCASAVAALLDQRDRRDALVEAGFVLSARFDWLRAGTKVVQVLREAVLDRSPGIESR